MKTLILIRHATANNKRLSQQDKARNLSELGKRQAHNIAAQLKQKNCLADYLICSATHRAQQTAKLLCQTLHLDAGLIKIDDTLYSGDSDDILAMLRCVDTDTAQRLFVVGHNPHLSWLAHLLCKATKNIILPPAGVIALQFEIEKWDELNKAQGRLLFFIEPQHEHN